ncbi:STAS domain-containing protein [Parvularcula sp. ZS-1/3]|uniref:STAS domain-containing protein n=1 Tax=Parvularcula mediterranea TaxID=2732508 RepID=A0A7Y3W5I2_9PROT|nr:STAS domain-containing protein [Parvularcula mediterranea]NNU16311.1 STAS domain-containing protein [Parvularcula mediterranea]
MSEGGGYCQITLDAKLASRAAPELYERLSGHKDDTVVLDASKVEQVGVLCLQILASAHKSWSERGLEFEVVDPSAAFRESTETLGLDLSLIGVATMGEVQGGA